MKSTANLPEIDAQKVTAVVGGLALFGVVYDQISHAILKTRKGEQKSSYFVALGTAVTIAASIPLIGPQAALRVLLAFAASGTPMIGGQVIRFSRAMRRTKARARRLEMWP